MLRLDAYQRYFRNLMHRLLQRHRWASYLVAGLLLFATSGATLSRMTCLAGGHSILSLGQARDCCPEGDATDTPVLKATCCDLSEARLDQPDLLLAKQLALVPFIADHAFVVAPSLELVGTARPEWLDSRPPPMDVPERLALLRTRLI